MSQRAEKYARSMEGRVAKLEGQVDKINMDVTHHGVRLSTAEKLRSAMGMPAHFIQDADFEIREKQLGPGRIMEIEDRRAERAERRKRVARCRRLLLAGVLVLIALVCLVIATHGATADNAPPAMTAETVQAVNIVQATAVEEPPEPEKIEAALPDQGYFSDVVPLPYDLQDTMQTECAQWGCPYPLALAVAEVESSFALDAVGAANEVGIMQLNPGPGRAYHTELEAATGQDPTTPAGNIACGTYLLGKYMEKYEDPAKAAMAYNMGEGGAREAWAAGITSTKYSTAVLAAMEEWECTVSTGNGG